MAADHVHHICWNDWEAKGLESPVADVYRVLDEAVGRLAELSGPHANLMIVSDHGAGPLHGVVNLNAWLAQEGLLAYATGGGVKGRELLGKALELRRHLPERWRYAAKQRLPKLRDRAQERSDYSVLDWSQTRAFAYGTFGNIVINVRGREANGTVEPGEEYDRVRDEIAAKVGDLRGPGGESIVADVHRREDLFHGPELDKVPDLLVEFDRYAWLGKGNLKTRSDSLWDEIEIEDSEHHYVGSHRHEGIAVLTGPAVAGGASLSGELVDVAPTLLYLLGEAIPSDLEGRVLFEALRPEILDERPPEYDDAAPTEFDSQRAELEDEGAAEVERRLRGSATSSSRIEEILTPPDFPARERSVPSADEDSAGSGGRRALGPLLGSRAVATSPRSRLLAVLAVAALSLVFVGQATAAPAKPIIRVNATTATSVTVGWRAVQGAVSYRVALNGTVVETTTARSATVDGILCGGRYTVTVRAVGPLGGSRLQRCASSARAPAASLARASCARTQGSRARAR